MGVPHKDPSLENIRVTGAQATTWTQRWIALTLTAILALKLCQLYPSLVQDYDTSPLVAHNKCTPPSPNLFALHPPRSDEKLIKRASKDADNYLKDLVLRSDIDSISVGVVTPAGILFESGHGVLKANETNKDRLPVDRNTIYRIASVTKMFTVLETLILREKGVLSWDDPVDKYLPEIQPYAGGWRDLLTGTLHDTTKKPRITLRQLATHLSGIGRDYPPIHFSDWPLHPDSEPPEIEVNLNYSEIVKSVSQYPLVNRLYHYPVYSNTGMDILGLANVAANAKAYPDFNSEPKTHRDLIQRDIFDPLGFTHSFYRIPGSDLRERIAVPSPSGSEPDMTESVLSDAHEPCGAQYSSLGDLSKLMQMILSPKDGTLLSRDTVREWLHPIHSWGLGQSVGAPWEITSFDDVQVFSKGGNLIGHHAEFSLVPEYSYGIIVLVTGSYSDTAGIMTGIMKHFHPAFKSMQTQELRKKYAGKWTNGDDLIEVAMRNGIPHIQTAMIGGEDILENSVVPLWTTGRPDEFRMAFGRPEMNSKPGAGCMPYWVSIGVGVHARDTPIDLIYWREDILHYPSAGVALKRVI